MRVKIFALACVAALATVMPARADIIIGYRLSTFVPATQGTSFPPGSPIPTNAGLGTPITGNSALNPLVINQGDTVFLQMTITANNAAPYSPAQQGWDPANLLTELVSTGLIINYPTALVSQPFTQPTGAQINLNRSNASSNDPYAGGHPNTFTGYNMGQTAITGATTGAGYAAGPGGLLPETVMYTFKLVANGGLGDGQVTISDLNTAPTAAGFGLSDGTNLDPIIFAAAHNGSPLFFSVVAVPEPSSMALAGLAIAGFGWRKLRRKTAVVA